MHEFDLSSCLPPLPQVSMRGSCEGRARVEVPTRSSWLVEVLTPLPPPPRTTSPPPLPKPLLARQSSRDAALQLVHVTRSSACDWLPWRWASPMIRRLSAVTVVSVIIIVIVIYLSLLLFFFWFLSSTIVWSFISKPQERTYTSSCADWLTDLLTDWLIDWLRVGEFVLLHEWLPDWHLRIH